MTFPHWFALVGALSWGLSSCGDVAEEADVSATSESTMTPAMLQAPPAPRVGEGLDAGGAPSESGLRRGEVRFCAPIARSDGSLQRTCDATETLRRPGVVVVACSDKERTTRVHLEVAFGEGDVGVLEKGHTLRLRMHPLGASVDGQLGINAEEADVLQVLEDDEKASRLILDSNRLDCTFEGGASSPIRLELRSNCLPAHARDASSPPALPQAHLAHLSRGHAESLAVRAPREVWFELEHRGAQGELLGRDVSLCTLAPFTFRCELDAPEQIHAVLIPDAMTDVGEKRGNVGFLMALLQMAEEAGVAKATLGVTDPMQPDPWAQDSHLFGYGVGPNGAQAHYVLRAFRNKKDGQSFTEENGLTLGRAFQFRGSVPRPDCCQDYGGNFVVSPPITAEAQERMGEQSVAPAAAHADAPYGKIIFGTSGRGGPSRTMRDFLEAHRLQPLLPIDLSALRVGHADEVLSFIPAPREGQGHWKMLFASTPLAHRLLQSLHRRTGAQPILHELWTDEGNYEIGVYSSHEILKSFGIEPSPERVGQDSVERDNEELFRFAYERLPIVRQDLINGLSVREVDIIDVPILFSQGDVNDVRALLPNLVNLQVLGETLVVPKSYGPRVPVDVARELLVTGGGISQEEVSRVHLDSLTKEVLWMSSEQSDHLVTHLEALAKKAHEAGGPVPVRVSKNDVVSERDLPPPVRALLQTSSRQLELTRNNIVAGRWHRVELTWTDSVPLFAAYLVAKVQPLGVQVRFIDDWQHYHSDGGEVHCGTNVSRAIPTVPPNHEWWLD